MTYNKNAVILTLLDKWDEGLYDGRDFEDEMIDFSKLLIDECLKFIVNSENIEINTDLEFLKAYTYEYFELEE